MLEAVKSKIMTGLGFGEGPCYDADQRPITTGQHVYIPPQQPEAGVCLDELVMC